MTALVPEDIKQKADPRPVSELLDAVDLRGGHLYESNPDPRYPIGGVITGIGLCYNDTDFLIETRIFPDLPRKNGIIVFERCTYKSVPYMQCEKGTFGWIVIDDPVTGKQLTIHGVRLCS